MQGLVTVFGGSGFVGRYVVRALAAKGWRVRVATRRPFRNPELTVMGAVGQIELAQANLRMDASVARAIEGAEAVVNLVGVLYEAGPQRFQSLHAMAAENLAKAAAGVRRFVHISALGADETSPSKYARTKAMGEAAVREALPAATIIRPSVVFGPEDNFFNKFAGMAAMSPALPLIGGGGTKFQPVYAGDVGAAVANALDLDSAQGKTFELGGPATYSFKEILELVLKETLHKRALVPLPFPIARVIGSAGDLLAMTPFPPPLTSDQVELLKADNVVSPGAPGLADLGVTPTALEGVISTYLWKYRRGGQFAQPEAANA